MTATRVAQLERLPEMSRELTLAETEEQVFWITARATSDLLSADRTSVVTLTRTKGKGRMATYFLRGAQAG